MQPRKKSQTFLKMISKDSYIISLLLAPGRYIAERRRPSGKHGYCLYEGKRVPVGIINPRSFKTIEHLLKEQNGVFILSRKSIIQLHGNSKIKRTYKSYLLNNKKS